MPSGSVYASVHWVVEDGSLSAVKERTGGGFVFPGGLVGGRYPGRDERCGIGASNSSSGVESS